MAHAPAGEHDVDIGPGPPARHHHGRPRDRPGELDRAAGGLRSDQAWTPGTHQCARTWRILASEHFRSSDREGLWRWMWADCGRRSAADGTGSARMRVERPAAGRSSAPVRERRRRWCARKRRLQLRRTRFRGLPRRARRVLRAPGRRASRAGPGSARWAGSDAVGNCGVEVEARVTVASADGDDRLLRLSYGLPEG